MYLALLHQKIIAVVKTKIYGIIWTGQLALYFWTKFKDQSVWLLNETTMSIDKKKPTGLCLKEICQVVLDVC